MGDASRPFSKDILLARALLVYGTGDTPARVLDCSLRLFTLRFPLMSAFVLSLPSLSLLLSLPTLPPPIPPPLPPYFVCACL